MPLALFPDGTTSFQISLQLEGCGWCEPALSLGVQDLRLPRGTTRRTMVKMRDQQGQWLSLLLYLERSEPSAGAELKIALKRMEVAPLRSCWFAPSLTDG